jgi:hypothetical protein
MTATPEPTGTDAPAELCTSAVDWLRHRAGELVIPLDNAFLGLNSRRGTTACGLAEAMDQPELDLLNAEWKVPKDKRAHIERLPPCPACFPLAAA